MKIGSPSGPRSTAPAARATRATAAGGTSSVSATSATSAAAPVDTASIMGIPEAELTSSIRAALGQLMTEVQTLRQELSQAKKRIAYLEDLSDQDPLVPLLNRRAFVRELSRFMAFAERYGVAGSVIYFDVNGMKDLNDTLGHSAGDAALNHVAATLVASVRESDIVGRLGGDEFAVILAQADEAVATQKAQELAEIVGNSPFVFEDHSITVRASFGVCCFTGAEGVEAALDAADRAMYEHKRNSSFRVRIERPDGTLAVAKPREAAGADSTDDKAQAPSEAAETAAAAPAQNPAPSMTPPSVSGGAGVPVTPATPAGAPQSAVGKVMPAGQLFAAEGAAQEVQQRAKAEEAAPELDPSGLPRLRSDN
ncbi:GGDEF domain-containing protein [Rhodovibrionaceae bacterium A322]